MKTNDGFGLIIRKSGTIKNSAGTYLEIFNDFDNAKNIVEINGVKYNLTLTQFQDVKTLIEKYLPDIIKISKEQTPDYLDENALEGYCENITVIWEGKQIFVDFAVMDEKTTKMGEDLISAVTKIFTK